MKEVRYIKQFNGKKSASIGGGTVGLANDDKSFRRVIANEVDHIRKEYLPSDYKFDVSEFNGWIFRSFDLRNFNDKYWYKESQCDCYLNIKINGPQGLLEYSFFLPVNNGVNVRN